MIKAGKYLIALMWLLPLAANAQKELFKQFQFRRLDEAQGLTNNVINDIAQDTLGQIWVATNEGLFRYQGSRFQQFLKGKENTHFLHNNFVDQLYLDSQNDVWLMTDDGVGRYSYQTDIIERYLPEQITGRISSMAVDQSGVKYFGKYEYGLLQVKGDSVSVLDLSYQIPEINFNHLSMLKVATHGHFLWALVSDRGVIRYNTQNGNIVFFSTIDLSGRQKLQQFDLKIDADGLVWISTELGVLALSVDQDTSEKKVDHRLEQILPEDDYLTIFKCEKELLWVGSRNHGMFTIGKGSSGYQLLSHVARKADENGISSSTVSEIFQDRSGYFWVGTHNGGINVFHPEGETVRNVTHRLYDSEYSLALENVWGMTRRGDGKIWVGTDGDGISLLDPATGLVQNHVIRELNSKAVLSALEDTRGRLWLGTYMDGIFLYDSRSGSVRQYKEGLSNADFSVNDIRCFYEDASGKIFVGTNQGGLYYLDESTGRIVLINGTGDYDIRSISSAGDDILWIGTFGKGVLKYHVGEGRLLESPWSTSALHKDDVILHSFQSGDTLWAATRHNALVAFDTRKEEFITLSGLDALDGRSVSGLVRDKFGNIWMTLNSGVACFNPATGALRQFGVENGFQRGHFNFGSILYTADGYLAMGGIHGLNMFYPQELLAEKRKSSIVLNQFKIFNQVVNPSNSEVFADGKSIFLTDKVELDHSENIFSIQFSFPGFTSGSSDLAYLLENYDQKWQQASGTNVATYRNVPPGHYIFRVKSLENGTEKALFIIVLPPLWKTWPAYCLYMLIIGLVIWRLNRFSNSRMALKQKLQFEQEMREKESAVMQEKLRFYTNFSHELKTPLTLIQGPVDDLLEEATDPRHKNYLKLIKKNTNVILRFINRMLEFRKIEMNKTVLNVGLHDLKILAQEEAESFAYLAKEKEIKFGFYCQNELNAWLDLEKIQIVMNNLLSNAFKYTPPGKTVNFGVFEEDGQIVIEVKDKGVGIKQDELKNVFSPFFQASNSYGSGGTGIGLALSKSFVELHKGTIEMTSEEGNGTKFLIRIAPGKEKFDGMENVRFIDAGKKEAELLDLHPEEVEDHAILEQRENEKMLLVVDDNKDIATYIESIFSEEYRVVKAENGLEAYEKAVGNSPDIIISDLMMPGMDGLEFCEKIKTNISTSHIPVIMVTAKDSMYDKVKGYEVGVDGYITKPFSSEVLKARVQNLLKNRELLELKYESNDLIDLESSKSTREAEFILTAEKITLQMLERSEFSVPQLCKELGMSQSALYRKIKSLTGVSIQVFIRKIRIKRAAQLLLAEDMTVTEIAFSLEFSDLKYFRKCFKDQFGLSPSEYKSAQLEKSEKGAAEG